MYMYKHCSQKAGLAIAGRVSFWAVQLSPAATAASLYQHGTGLLFSAVLSVPRLWIVDSAAQPLSPTLANTL